jgi:hypothetical protein
VILRIVPGRVGEGGAAGIAARYSEHYIADASGRAGLVRYHVAIDDDSGELVSVTVWESLDDARAAFGGELTTPAALGGLALVADLAPASHYDIGSTWIQRDGPDPETLRIAIGRFTKPGSDVEMQELLRERVPTVGDEMVEACVGRRIVDRSVEVMFFSSWRRPPPEFRLEAAFWPDISLRYDEFSVRTYRRVQATR